MSGSLTLLSFVLYIYIILVTSVGRCVCFVCFVDDSAFVVANYQLNWNSHFVTTLLLKNFTWFVFIYIAAACKVVVPKRAQLQPKVEN